MEERRKDKRKRRKGRKENERNTKRNKERKNYKIVGTEKWLREERRKNDRK